MAPLFSVVVFTALDEDLVRHEVARGISGYPHDIYAFYAMLSSLTDDPGISARLAEVAALQNADAEHVRGVLAKHGSNSNQAAPECRHTVISRRL